MTTGRTLRIYLSEGTASGILTAEIMNWTGKVLVAPRSRLADLANREESKKTGVYILVGDDPSSPLKNQIYIGESDNVLKRLTQHNGDSNKDFWSRSVIIISKDSNLTKSHVRYLESRMIQLSTQANNASINNATAPEGINLPESDISDMEYFLDQMNTLLPVLGFPFMISTPSIQNLELSRPGHLEAPSQSISPIFYANSSEYNAEAQEIDSSFIVFKGSKARKVIQPSLAKTLVERREQYIRDGKLVDSPDGTGLLFSVDVEFSSPSGAAGIVSGMSVNGRAFWKVKETNQNYNQWDQARLANAEMPLSTD